MLATHKQVECRRHDRRDAGHARGGFRLRHHAQRRFGPRRRLSRKAQDRRASRPHAHRAGLDRRRGVASHGRDLLASMGIYLFNRDLLVDVLTKTDYHDFGREVFPASIAASQSADASVRRLLGRHRHDQIVLPVQPRSGGRDPPFDLRVGRGADLHAGEVPAPFANRRGHDPPEPDFRRLHDRRRRRDREQRDRPCAAGSAAGRRFATPS